MPESVVVPPAHMVALAPALTVGRGVTVTVTVVVPVQPTPLVPVTVYVVVADGEAVGLAQLAQDNPVAGLQLKVLAPEAVRVVDAPAHMVLLPDTETAGVAFTDTTTVDVFVHPAALVPVTV